MRRLLGAVLLILGVLLMVYGGFSYTKETREARIGGLGLQIKKRERVEIPPWVGAAVAIAGGALLATRGRGEGPRAKGVR